MELVKVSTIQQLNTLLATKKLISLNVVKRLDGAYVENEWVNGLKVEKLHINDDNVDYYAVVDILTI